MLENTLALEFHCDIFNEAAANVNHPIRITSIGTNTASTLTLLVNPNSVGSKGISYLNDFFFENFRDFDLVIQEETIVDA